MGEGSLTEAELAARILDQLPATTFARVRPSGTNITAPESFSLTVAPTQRYLGPVRRQQHQRW
jgi:hypothetical protein